MKKNLLPCIEVPGEPPVDGALYPTPRFCLNKFKGDSQCKRHYESIKSAGTKLCPYGYLSVAHEIADGKLKIYSAIADGEMVDVKSLKKWKRLPPKINQDILNYIEAENDKFVRNSRDMQTYQELVHDIRNINQLLKSSAEDIEDQLLNGRVVDQLVTQRISSVIAASNLLSQRMSFLRYVQDAKSSRVVRAGIHKKFFKALQLFRLIGRSKQLNMPNIIGFSDAEVEVYDFFDCLPVILLENAVKYSPRGSDVLIRINEQSKSCTVLVENYGPTLSTAELERIRLGPYRGGSAEALGIPGSGLGLSFAQKVCTAHEIPIDIELGDVRIFDGKTCQRFVVRLSFQI